MSSLEISHLWVDQIIAQSQLIIDFGLVILIWMVQLIIYPSFTYYSKENLVKWHQKYTNKIAVVVIPLMLMQLFLAIIVIYLSLSFTSVITLIIVLFLWIFTFMSFAPRHFKIAEGKITTELLVSLIRLNWVRTFLWSLLFILHLAVYFFQ